MTLNVWGLAQPIAQDVAARLRAIGAALPALQCDIAAFQEVWTEEAARILTAAGEQAGFLHAWGGPEPTASGGLLVISRLPLLQARFEPYITRGLPERVAHMDYWGEKGFLELQLVTDLGAVTLFNTHLHAQYRTHAYPEYRAHRMGQVVQLAARVRAVSGPVIAVGDFNLREGDPDYEAWIGLTRLRDVAAALDARQPTALGSSPYVESTGRKEPRIDYVFERGGVRTGVRATRIERVFDQEWSLDGRPATYSDHAGLRAELEIRHFRRARTLPAADLRAVELAAQGLKQGKELARSRRNLQRTGVGASLLGAWLAMAGRRSPRFSRRRLLRGMLGGAALLALPSACGFAALSEGAVPSELADFDRVERLLDAIRSGSVSGSGVG